MPTERLTVLVAEDIEVPYSWVIPPTKQEFEVSESGMFDFIADPNTKRTIFVEYSTHWNHDDTIRKLAENVIGESVDLLRGVLHVHRGKVSLVWVAKWPSGFTGAQKDEAVLGILSKVDNDLLERGRVAGPRGYSKVYYNADLEGVQLGA